MSLLLLSIAPSFIIAIYLYARDKYDKEPIGLLLMCLLAGAFSVIPILITEGILDMLGQFFSGLMAAFWRAFFVAALSEEFFKFLFLYLLIWRRKAFNEKFDGIIYAVFVSLGFATVENVMYVLGSGAQTGFVRAITAVPAHTIFGITMGFYFGLAKFYRQEQFINFRKALLYPIILHGIYDFILFTGYQWLTIVFFGFVIYLYIAGFRKMKEISNQSIFRTDYDLLNDKFENPKH